MNRIQILPEHIANKIAAGEVVQRPASVVKELVENSIDAESTRIVIEIEGGGKDLIRITDNGYGMSREDVELAFERHATSKITSVDDLDSIRSFGFRGEALPSIAAVSQVEVITCARVEAAASPLPSSVEAMSSPPSPVEAVSPPLSPKGTVSGTFLRIDGGVVVELRDIGAPFGTDITIRNLFFNTPARRKFLKTTVTEMGHINHIVSRIAMSHPHIAFKLTHNGSELINVQQTDSLLERAASFLGQEMARDILAMQLSTVYEGESTTDTGRNACAALSAAWEKKPLADGDHLSEIAPLSIEITGFLLPPSHTRPNRDMQSLFVNNRYIVNKTISHAIYTGYHTLIPNGRYPIVVLFLNLDPSVVDVNVHPTKAEVRFHQEREIHQLVVKAVRETLIKANLMPSMGGGMQLPCPAEHGVNREERIQGAINEYFKSGRAWEEVQRGQLPAGSWQSTAGGVSPIGRGQGASIPAGNGCEPENHPVSDLHPLCQIYNTYIIARKNDEICIIDQHAAHERVLYERLMAQERKVLSQMMLFPISLELDYMEAATMLKAMPVLNELGFKTEGFGQNTFIIRAVPVGMEKSDPRKAVLEVIHDIQDTGKTMTGSELRETMLISMSCKAAIKAGQVLSVEEMYSLLDQLAATQQPHTCPHGRPTMILLGMDELEKRFMRR